MLHLLNLNRSCFLVVVYWIMLIYLFIADCGFMSCWVFGNHAQTVLGGKR